MTAEQYAAQWKIDADAFERKKTYAWMRERLGDKSVVLEIGCGAGRSTLELAKHAKVIAVEANEHLAQECQQYLQSKSVPCTITHKTPEPLDSQVTIVLADLFDPSLLARLSGKGVDAIACWLIGGDPDRIATNLGKATPALNLQDISDYREKAHARCYELGRELLPHDGVVHTVDRMGIPTWSAKNIVRDQLRELHEGLAGEAFRFPIDSTWLLRFDDSFNNSQIRVSMGGASAAPQVQVMASVIGKLEKNRTAP